MKQLISLISGEGKTKEQLTQEVWQAFQKYQKVSKKVESQTTKPGVVWAQIDPKL